MDFDWVHDDAFLAQLFDEEMEDLSDFWHPSVTMSDAELINIVEHFERQQNTSTFNWADVSFDDHELCRAVELIEAR